jgi:hypothetical protein
MACLSVRFSCPIDTVGSNTAICSWIVTCCDGKEIQIDVPVNTFSVYCLDNPSKDNIIPNGTGGEWTTKGLECDTNCGTADPTPIAGYVYYEYENCNATSQKQIFRAPAGFTAWPNTMAYQSICWSNGVSTSSTSSLDIEDIQQVFADCATCLAAIAPTPPPTCPEIPAGIPRFCLSFINSLEVKEINNIQYYFINNTFGVYDVNVGVYQITGVPAEWPIAFLNNGIENEISYTGTNLELDAVGLDGNTYSFYSGTITLNVNDDFGCISYQTAFPTSTNGQYFAGENNLRFSTDCNPSSPPVPTPTPTPVTPPSVVPPIPSPVDTEWTVSYSQNSQGWPSFYSYIPEYMIGMNNFFYTFKGGNLFQHNTNPLRNNYYGQQFHSQITSVFNQNPLENKIFKTLNLESNDAWQSYLETDIQINGFMQDGWFEKKEGAWFAYLRQRGEVPALKGQYAMRSANGIGKTSSVAITQGTTTLSFSTDPLVSIGNFISVGDYVYHAVPQYTDVVFGGIVTQINIDLQNGINQLIVSTTSADTVPFPLDNPYIMFIKSSEAESHGLLGHYCIFTISNFNTQATELFAVESEVMKSYP